MARRKNRRSAPWRAVGVAAAGVLLTISAVTQASNAAFVAAVKNSQDVVGSGTVVLVDDDSAALMFAANDAAQGDSYSECVKVTYTGTSYQITPVKMYASLTTNVNGLASYVNVTVQEGTGGGYQNCAGFTASSTLINGSPLTTVTSTYTDFATGRTTFTPTSASTTRTYRFTIALSSSTPDTLIGSSASATFTWEVHSA